MIFFVFLKQGNCYTTPAIIVFTRDSRNCYSAS